MSHGRMAMGAARHLVLATGCHVAGLGPRQLRVSIEQGHHRPMAPHAVVLQNPKPRRLDRYGLLESLGGELLPMPPTVLGFGEVLGNEGLRQVAIHTHRNRVMASLLPAIELGLHDVAIHARRGISTEVGQSLGVAEEIGNQLLEAGGRKILDQLESNK